jgi:hypothetical protein
MTGARCSVWVWGWAVCRNLARLRQGGRGRHYPGQQSDGRHQRHFQRQGGYLQGGLEYRNHDHCTERGDHWPGQGDNAQPHLDQQRELPRKLTIASFSPTSGPMGTSLYISDAMYSTLHLKRH